MSQQDGPQFTAISKQLATHMPTEGIPEEGVADAIRSTLYAAQDKGILEPVAKIIEGQANGDEAILELVRELK